MTELVDWIKAEMEAMGTPPAYSYQVGIYHGMEKVLKKIESGVYQELTDKDTTIERLERQIKSVNEAIADGPDTMTANEWQDWLYSTLPFLGEPLGEGDSNA